MKVQSVNNTNFGGYSELPSKRDYLYMCTDEKLDVLFDLLTSQNSKISDLSKRFDLKFNNLAKNQEKIMKFNKTGFIKSIENDLYGGSTVILDDLDSEYKRNKVDLYV